MARFSSFLFSVFLGALAVVIGRASAELIDPAPHTEFTVPWNVGEMLGDPLRNVVYVLNPSGAEILSINTVTGRVDARTRLSGVPGFLGMSVDGNTLYVTLPSSSRVQILSAGSLQTRDVVNLPFSAGSFVVDAYGYFYAPWQNYLRKVDLATGAIVGSHSTYPTEYLRSSLLRRDAAGRRLFIMEMGLSGGGSGLSEFAIHQTGMPTFVGTRFLSMSNDQDLAHDETRNTLYRSSGGVYGLGVWDVAKGAYSYWPFTDGAPYGTAVTHLSSSEYVYAGSGSGYDGRIVKYRKSDGVPVFTYRTDTGSPTGAGLRGYADINTRGLAISGNGHLVYAKDDIRLGLIGGAPIVVLPAPVPPTIDAGVNRSAEAGGTPLMLSAAISDVSNDPAERPPTDLLEAWWKMDAGPGLVDDSGKNRNVAVVNTEIEVGKAGNAFSFKSANQSYVGLASHAAALDALGTGSFSFWVKTTATGPGTIFSMSTSSPTSRQFVRILVNDGFLRFEWTDSSAIRNFTTSRRINDGQWHHIAITAPDSYRSDIYVDGDNIDTPSRALFFNGLGGITSVDLGRTVNANGIGADYFDGAIDDFRIYGRLLNPQEVIRLAAALPAMPAPAVSWSLESGPGNVSLSGADTLTPSASFLVPGRYALRATVSNDFLSASDLVWVTVEPPKAKTLFSAADPVRYAIPYWDNDLRDSTGRAWSAIGFNDSSWPVGAQGVGYDRGSGTPHYGSHLATLTEASNYWISPALLLRKHFQISDPADYKTLRLKLRYDDGAIVFLNGVEVVRTNVPEGALAWNTLALAARSRTDAVTLQEFDLSAFRHLLRSGDNVLAVHVVNVSADSENLLAAAELVAVPSLAQLYYKDWTLRVLGVAKSISDSSQDAETDGRVDLHEYAFGGDPLRSDKENAGRRIDPVVEIQRLGPNRYLYIHMNRQQEALRGLSYRLLFSHDCKNWFPANTSGFDVIELSAQPLGGGLERATFRLSAPLSVDACFVRIEASLTP